LTSDGAIAKRFAGDPTAAVAAAVAAVAVRALDVAGFGLAADALRERVRRRDLSRGLLLPRARGIFFSLRFAGVFKKKKMKKC
jgi:hypothetical protein